MTKLHIPLFIIFSVFLALSFARLHRIYKSWPSETSTYQVSRSKAQVFAEAVNTGDCFYYQKDVKAEYSFQKDYMDKGNINVVIAKDINALLIAQPNPQCDFSHEESYKCRYWFRTVPLDHIYLFSGNDKLIKCPEELSLDNMKDRLIRSNYSNEFQL